MYKIVSASILALVAAFVYLGTYLIGFVQIGLSQGSPMGVERSIEITNDHFGYLFTTGIVIGIIALLLFLWGIVDEVLSIRSK
ncbi:hypothetical protein ACE1TF_04950 [Geomicrobium sp. JSM 1781026]|uniref:hypothetical protein n=1 Tax=Geomicrobium sp. JSM 1781026 TaxID=3344580 RepID=UPI0035C036D6